MLSVPIVPSTETPSDYRPCESLEKKVFIQFSNININVTQGQSRQMYSFLCLFRPLSRPSCITDRNVFGGQNVGQLCGPPPFVTFNLTTISPTAPIRRRRPCDVTAVYPITAQFTHCDTGVLESLPTVGLAVTFTVHPQSWIVSMKCCRASLWSLPFQSTRVKSQL